MEISLLISRNFVQKVYCLVTLVKLSFAPQSCLEFDVIIVLYLLISFHSVSDIIQSIICIRQGEGGRELLECVDISRRGDGAKE